MQVDMADATLIWIITIAPALLVNQLKIHELQLLVAASLLGVSIMVLLQLNLPSWFVTVSIFFMSKVMFSFAVNHYGRNTIKKTA